MANDLKPASTFVLARVPTVDSSGVLTWNGLKVFQDWDTKLRNGLNSLGQVIGDIAQTTKIAGRVAIGTILQFIDDGGQVTAGGIDFSRDYINKDTDHITDGLGSPLAGGRVAFSALVDSAPVVGQTIRFNGTDWLPVSIAQSLPAVSSQWLKSYDATTGLFTQTRPAFTDISGTLASAQLPANAAKTDAPNVFTRDQEIDGTTAFPAKLSSADVGATALRLLNTSNSSGAWIGLVGSAGVGGAPSGSVAVEIDGVANCPVFITPTALTIVGGLHAQSIVLTSAASSSSASAGPGSALPATPAGYLDISINGNPWKIPFYTP